MKTLHLATVGTAVALAAGANAAILVLDHFDEGDSLYRSTPGTSGPLIEPTGIGSFGREVTLQLQTAFPGTPEVQWNVNQSYGNYFSSDSADGKLTIKYGLYVDSSTPVAPMNLDRSMFGLAGGVGIYILGWSSDLVVPFKVTIESGNGANFYVYDLTVTGLPSSLVPDPWIVDGNDPLWTGTVDLTDIDYVTFEFDAFRAGDFKVDALGIPEPHEYAAVATLGLLGFAAFRRLQRRS